MIEVKIESINKEDLNTDVLFEIANEIFKGNPKEKQAKAIKETLEKAPTLEQMKEDLDVYNKIAKVLSEKIKEEEKRRRKNAHHLIEKKVRTIKIEDEILAGTDREGYTTKPKKILDKEILKYVRKGNTIECTISNKNGKFKGLARRHEDDKFSYKSGMELARVRAMKNMYAEIESYLVNKM